jgi:hypothetical protein
MLRQFELWAGTSELLGDRVERPYRHPVSDLQKAKSRQLLPAETGCLAILSRSSDRPQERQARFAPDLLGQIPQSFANGFDAGEATGVDQAKVVKYIDLLTLGGGQFPPKGIVLELIQQILPGFYHQ